MHSIIRLARVGAAVAALLALAAGSAAAATTSPGVGGGPGLEIGGTTAIVTTVVHNSRHEVVTSVMLGDAVHPAVTVSGASGTPSGNVTISFWTNGTCSGTGAIIVSAPLASGSLDASLADYPATTLGALSYRTHYAGDGVYPATNSGCAAVTITKLDPSVTLAIHDDQHVATTTAYVGMSLHAYASVSGRLGAPTGTVKIYRWNGSSCSGTASVVGPYSLSAGKADTSYQWVMDTVGTFAYRATYSGDGTYNPSFSTCIVVTVVKWPVAFATEMHSRFETVITHAYVGDAVHAAATLSGGPGTPTGTVQVRIYNGAGCSGAPTESDAVAAAAVIDPAGPKIVGFEPGNISWQLEYLGNATFASVTGPCMTINFKSGPTVDVSIRDASDAVITTITTGEPVHARVNVSGIFGTPTGKVSITWFATGTCSGPGTTLGTRTLSNGVVDDATLHLVPTKAGTYSFDATYLGDTAYAGDGSNCAVVKVVAAPAVTPKPTTAPTAPASTPNPTQQVAAATSAPDPTDVPAASADPSPAPSAAPIPSAAAPAPSASATAAAATQAAGAVATTSGPGSASGDGGLLWIFLLLVLLLIAALVVWAARRATGQRRGAPEATR